MKYLYLPMHARYSSFIAGALISLHLHNTAKQQHSPSLFWKALGWILYVPSVLLFLSLFRPPPLEVLPEIDIIASVASRQIFAIIFGFLVYCTLVPESHPFHARFLKKIMGLSFWYPLSAHSNGTYIFHLRIQFFVVYGLLKPSSPESVNMELFAKAMAIVLPFTYLAALLEYLFVEAPIARLRHRWLSGGSKQTKKEQ